MNSLPHPLLQFPCFWYIGVPRRFFLFLRNLTIYLDQTTTATLMLRLLLTPLFGDETVIGYLLAFIFRILRGLGGLLLIIVTDLALLAFFLAWLLLPVFIVWQFGVFGLIVLGILWLGYGIARWEQPRKVIAGPLAEGDQPEEYTTPEVEQMLELAQGSSRELLTQVLDGRSARQVLGRLGYDKKALLQAGEDKWGQLGGVLPEEAFRVAYEVALELGSKHIHTQHLLLALLRQVDFQAQDTKGAVEWLRKEGQWRHPPALWDERYQPGPLGGFNRSWTGRATPTLDRYSWDLTAAAQKGQLPGLIGKDKPLREALRILEKSGRQNVILVGDPGCGKTSLVYGMANAVIRGTEYRGLQDRRIVSLDIGKLSAGAKTGGELQERLVGLVEELEGSRNVILFIDEIHNAVAAGGGVDTSLIFSTLEPHLSAGRFQVIGATSWNNYRKYIEPNEAFARLFELVEIPEASPQETLEVLEWVGLDLERERGVTLSYPALKATVELSKSFIHDRVLPDKAVGVLEEVVSAVARERPGEAVLVTDVEQVISEKAKMPVGKIQEGESEVLLKLEEKMHERLIGQDAAVKAAADAIRRARVGLREGDRPIASLLFVGPTGVGKTEMAKTLAEAFFGDEKRMVRVDMSEYQEAGSVNRLIGAPAPPAGGWGQAAEPGQLTDAVRRNPYSLLLLDEMEKAHPRILDIFLQVLEDGRLTDAAGHTVDFTNVLLIFTSNAGSSLIYEGLRQGQEIDALTDDLRRELEKAFRIEFLNRFDGIIIFKPLTQPQVEKIARMKLARLTKLLRKDKKVEVTFSEGLIKRLAREGYDPALGARPLRRLIQDRLESPLAMKILQGEIKEGGQVEVGEEILQTAQDRAS